MLTLTTEIININKVGKVIAQRLKKLNIQTAQDLLYFFPFRYEDYSQLSKINDLKIGENVNIVGTVELIQNKRSPRRRINITECLVSDDSASIKIIWFNQPFIIKNLHSGDKISLAGKVEEDFSGVIMKSPIYEKIYSNANIHTQGMVPVYHSTSNITQKQIRFLTKQIIDLTDKIEEWLTDDIIKNNSLLPLNQALKKIHFPLNNNDILNARKRIAFDELFLLQLQSQITKKELKNNKAKKIKFIKKETQKFVNNLPFKLTDDQKKSAWQILQDLEKDIPMSRLLEGDVGSGKTVVAVMAMLNVVLNKKQAVLMVPTEILAKQHFESISKMLNDFKITIGLITRSNKLINKNLENKKQKINSKIIIQNSKIIIGTHALLQEKIKFDNLALVIIDEQHRFGVEQRKSIIEKSNSKYFPHLLSMTATPIPRSLALALYGDLNVSIINEMPKGRKNIITKIISEQKRNDAYKFIKEQIKNNKQIFVICPLIDISDKMGVKSAKEEYKKLNEKIFPDIKIGILHGKIKSKEKNQIMLDFLNNKIKILVATSVVEVGVDIPNATIMMIEGADRFGLAQLHQFRGRVGRSEYQSYCFLFSDNESKKTLDRLNALTKYNNGFELAKIDLKLRGPGEIYGTSQKGFPELKIASLFDYQLINKAKIEAEKIIIKDPELNNHPKIKNKLNKLINNTHLE